MLEDDVTVLLEDRHGDEQVEVGAVVVRPEVLPQAQDIEPVEFALEPYQQHAEEEEEVG